jgi:AraC-like DNA-binding protein
MHDVVYPIFSWLPSFIHIPNQEGRPIYWLAMAMQGIGSELQGARPGYEAVVSRLMDILFIMVMRSWIDQHASQEKGWLSALVDPYIGVILNALHEQPNAPWTLDKLAQLAMMSRSAVVDRFTSIVGEPPMRYLTRWRIQLATTWLHDDDQLTLEQIAHRVGYTNAFAFSKAFKRIVGLSPSEYRDGID